MEALEKDFQDFVSSEEQEILDAVEPIQEEPVAEEDTEEILEEEEEEITAEELEAFKELIAELKKENPDIDFDNVDIVISEDGEVEVYEEKFAKDSTPQSRRNARLRYQANKGKIKLQRRQRKGKPIDKEKSKRMKKVFALLKHFDPSDVASDDAVAIGEEQQDILEYTPGKQKRPKPGIVFRTIDGELEKVRRWMKTTRTKMTGKKQNEKKAGTPWATKIANAMKRSKAVKAAAKLRKKGEAETAGESVDYIDALSNGETLSETFKDKAQVIFETAVNNEVESYLLPLQEELETVFEEEYQTAVNEMTTKVDSYMSYVVEGWMEENKMTIESGIRADIAEDFMSGLKKLFTENYITVPEEKVDVVEELATKVKVLEEKLNQEVTANIQNKKELSEHKQSDILTSLTSDLTFNDQEKLREVAKGVIFENESDYTEKIQTLKESYFPNEETQESGLLTEETEPTFEQSSGSMDFYTQAIARSIK